MKLVIEFSEPEHGWLNVRVADDRNEVSLEVSDVPCNSLEALAGAMIHILDGSTNEQVEWSLEPEFSKWLFNVDKEDTSLEIYPDARQSSCVIFRQDHLALIRSVYQGLNRLGECKEWAIDEGVLVIWSWEFPKNEVRRLGVKLSEADGINNRDA